jgi:phospholipid transport system substrate-binding protein
MTMQGVYRKWVGTPPPGLEASATVDALRAICELDLSRAIIPATIRETRNHPDGAASKISQQGMLMSITLPDSRALLRLALASIALALGLGRAAVASEVTTPVEQLHAGLMAIMKAGKTAPFRQRYDMIAPVIGRTFDLEVILRQVIGPRLAALPPDQRAAVGDAFRRYTIASYVANFDTYSGQRFEVAPVVRAAGSDRVVETQIAAASGQGYVLDYVMRQESGGWKVVDVLVDGAISRVAAQRSEMRSMLADSGGAGLLVGLRQKTADLSGGILQ